MNRIVKVHERISPGFLTPFIFILSYTFEDKYLKGQGPVAVIRSRKIGVPHLSDSIIRKNEHRKVSCQATFPFPRIRADETPFPEQFRTLSASLISLYGFRPVKRSPAGRHAAGVSRCRCLSTLHPLHLYDHRSSNYCRCSV